MLSIVRLRLLFVLVLLASSAQLAFADPGSVRVKRLPAKITVETVPMILSPEKIPADPGEAGRATVAGVDLNRNGIRDDVERWIAQTFPKCARFRAALAQVALSVQRKIATAEVTEEIAKDLATEEGSATACFAVESESCESASIEKFIELSVRLQNTPERGKAYLRVYKILGNKSLEMPAGGCMIPPEQLPN